MVDNDVVKRLVIYYEQELRDLKKYRAIPFKEYDSDLSRQAEVERRFETTIQSAIDIGNHIIAQNECEAPKVYRYIFRILFQNKIIDRDVCEKMQDFSGFRNILSHEYREILNKRVHEKLTSDLRYLDEYIKQIVRYIEIEE